MKLNRWQQILTALVTLLVIFISAKQYYTSDPSAEYSNYNNYIIFKNSPTHLANGTNLYQSYNEEQYDLFKYTPTFALLFKPLAALPDLMGLGLWNLLNALVWLFALFRLQKQSNQLFIFGLIVGILELYIATLNSQSNALIAGLLLWAYIYLEKGDYSRASLFIWITVATKLFGILFFAMFIFYKGWQKKGVAYGLLWGIILFFLPTIFISFKELFWQYGNYFELLANDQSEFLKYSFLGWLKAWFGIEPSRTFTVLIALIFQLFLTAYVGLKRERLKIPLIAATWLLWMVVFNHMAESATFIIALTGIVLWWEYINLPMKLKWALIVPVILFTCLGPSDLYPKSWRMVIVADLQLKVFPCILIYGSLIWELLAKPKTIRSGLIV